ncbi:MAG TPA: hypothetical protein VE309_09835 [Caulobacteraceae bacterium]|nr:hypothetical protein [Caulobacteraceae bacterium]
MTDGAIPSVRRSRLRQWLLSAVLCGFAFSGPAFALDAPASPAPGRPGVAPAPPVTSMSAAQLKKINALLDDQGADQSIPAVIMTRLGLTQREVRQLGLIDRTSGDIHAYARLVDGGVLLTFVDAKTKLVYTYHFDARFKVVGSIVMAKAAPSEIATTEAGALAELSYWAQIADHI